MKVSIRKKEIIKVASQLFKDKGYNAVSMRDIALALGIKAASLYNHIEGKKNLPMEWKKLFRLQVHLFKK